MKLHLIVDGTFVIDKRLFLPEGRGSMYPAVAKSLLIETGKEKILVDTGIGNFPEGPKFDRMRAEQTIRRKKGQGIKHSLARLGIPPEEITSVINTHLHNSHCGGNNLFPNAQFYIAKAEFGYLDRVMSENPDQTAYTLENFDKVTTINETRGEYRITEDVLITPTPGHTTGHQSVIVSVGRRKLVYSGDVAPLKKNLTGRIAMKSYDREATIGSMNKLLAIKNADWIFSHDKGQLTLKSAYTPA